MEEKLTIPANLRGLYGDVCAVIQDDLNDKRETYWAIRAVKKLIEYIARVQAERDRLWEENARLKTPISDEEKIILTEEFDGERSKVWTHSSPAGSIRECTYAAVNALIAARAKESSNG